MKNSWFWLERVFESKSRFDAFNRKDSESIEHGVRYIRAFEIFNYFKSSFADPDPYDFGPPGSVSFYYEEKIVRKTLIY
jgi:hypothetical protein